MGWTDSHLHRFATGGAPFDPAARAFASDLDLDLDLDPARPGPARLEHRRRGPDPWERPALGRPADPRRAAAPRRARQPAPG
ncbi:MAG: hypothetical protein PGN11_16085 [Quadrisphaera sp.]